MRTIHTLIDHLAWQERAYLERTFLAPCVRGGGVCTRLDGLVLTFRTSPDNYEGWGIFQQRDMETAMLVRHADLDEVERYLRLFPQLRLVMALRLHGNTWLAYPANESDARQRFGGAHPVVVHLTERLPQFEQITARFDGAAFWYEDRDSRTSPIIAESLRAALHDQVLSEDLRIKGLTPEARIAYELAISRTLAGRERRQRQRDRARLDQALKKSGGALYDFHDHGDYWNVAWQTSDGELHTSAISKNDLTVVGAGICLSGRDNDFDLQSLVSVVDRRPEWMRG